MYFQIYSISCNLPQIPMNFGLTWVFSYLMAVVSYRDMSQLIKTFANERGIVSCVQVTVSKRCVEVWREHFHCRGVTFSILFSNLFILICCLNGEKNTQEIRNAMFETSAFMFAVFVFQRRPRLSCHFSPLFRRLSFFHDPCCEIMNI